MTGIEWTDYQFQPAPRTLLCQFRRTGQGQAGWFVTYAKDFLPEFNVANLEWRLTGIAREALEGMPEAVRQQAMPLGVPWSNVMLASNPGELVRSSWPGSLLSQLFS